MVRLVVQGTGFGGGAGAGGMVEVAAQALPRGSYDIEVGDGPNSGSNDPIQKMAVIQKLALFLH